MMTNDKESQAVNCQNGRCKQFKHEEIGAQLGHKQQKMFEKDRGKEMRKTALKRKGIAMIRDKFFATKQKLGRISSFYSSR